ncbi:hypothetical protein [Aquiflexum sp.]|uniref:hypothetical protein n=1 Tax=Aquiflexum sp. TaxID=1872584 RepID=UPI0035939C19
MKNQLKISAILTNEFGLRNIFLTMLMGILCYPVFGQMSETKTENKPMVNSLRTGTGEVISVHGIQLKSDINTSDFEKWVIEYWNPAMEGVFPGVKSFITMGDNRGDAIGKYAYVLIFDSLKTRDAYLPEAGKHSDWFKEIYYSPNRYLYEELFEFVESEAFSKYSSWVVLR